MSAEDARNACLRYPSAHGTGTLPDHCPGCRWVEVAETVELAVNSCYGTDPRHSLIGAAVADRVVAGTPIPWRLSAQFGTTTQGTGEEGQ